MNPRVNEYLEKVSIWQVEMKLLRRIVLNCGLVEELKWGVPCYTYKNSNVLLIHAFKLFCGLGFVKGALMPDPNKILVKPGKNTHGGRQIRFTQLAEIEDNESTIMDYVHHAIAIEKSGLKINYPKNIPLEMPAELIQKLALDSDFKLAFEALTSGRQRAYNMFFSEPKQSVTRDSRIEKSTSRILMGKGMNDCICGLSKKMPYCDGSHKYTKG